MPTEAKLDTRRFMDGLLKRYPREARKALRMAMQENMKHLEQEARALAPESEGKLEKSIKAFPAVKELRGKWIKGVESGVGGGFGDAANYIIRMHEMLQPAGHLKPGARTRAKPATPAGRPGGRFISRPLQHYHKKYMANIADKLRALK